MQVQVPERVLARVLVEVLVRARVQVLLEALHWLKKSELWELELALL